MFNFLNGIDLRIKKNKRAGLGWGHLVMNLPLSLVMSIVSQSSCWTMMKFFFVLMEYNFF